MTDDVFRRVAEVAADEVEMSRSEYQKEKEALEESLKLNRLEHEHGLTGHISEQQRFVSAS